MDVKTFHVQMRLFFKIWDLEEATQFVEIELSLLLVVDFSFCEANVAENVLRAPGNGKSQPPLVAQQNATHATKTALSGKSHLSWSIYTTVKSSLVHSILRRSRHWTLRFRQRR